MDLSYRGKFWVSTTILCLLFWGVVGYALAGEPRAVLQQFVNAYEDGDLAALPLAQGATENQSDSALRDHKELFRDSKYRELILKDIRWKDERITADYVVTVDDKRFEGVVTFRLQGGAIVRIDHEQGIEEGGGYWADAGQVVDKGSTVYGLSNGFVESNPVLGNMSSAGIVAVGAGLIWVRNTQVKRLPVGQCVQTSRLLGALGWGAGAYNVALMAGAASAAPFGLLAAVGAWNLPYKNECLDGPVQIKEMRYAKS